MPNSTPSFVKPINPGQLGQQGAISENWSLVSLAGGWLLRGRDFFWGGCRGPRGRGLSLETRHFCHFSGCCVRAGGECWCWELLSGCWGGLSEPWCWGAAGELAGALYFSEPVTFVIFGAARLLGSWRGPFISSLLVLLGAAGGLGLLGSWRGLFVSHNPSLLSLSALGGCWGAGGGAGGPFVSQNPSLLSLSALGGCWGAGGGAGGPFVSQNPSLLSLLRLGGHWGAAAELAGGPHFCHFWCWGAAGELLDSWKVLCFSEPVTFVTFGAAGGCWGTGGPLFLSLFGGCWAAGELGALCFLGGCWGAGVPFVSQNPSLLSLLVLGGGCWGAGALFLRTRHFCHFGLLSIGFGCR